MSRWIETGKDERGRFYLETLDDPDGCKAMHTWIFLNTCDEQAVYDKLGFTDEDNALLGSIGRPMVIGTVKQEDNDGEDD